MRVLLEFYQDLGGAEDDFLIWLAHWHLWLASGLVLFEVDEI